MAAFTVADGSQRLPDLAFRDASGTERNLADWRGRTVLLNLWATWCVPCRKEMPALDALEGKLGGPAFEVVAVNIDAGFKGGHVAALIARRAAQAGAAAAGRAGSPEGPIP